jgi:ubiquinone/menaquinone biosynthesis C-methylase UbiE
LPVESRYFAAGNREEVARLELQAEYLSGALASAFGIMKLRAGLKVLEVGCGSGAVSRKIAAAVHPATLVAVDIDDLFLDEARALSRKHHVSNVEFEKGDVNHLQYADRSFDLTFCRLVLRHQDDPVHSLKEMARVTRKGGMVAAMEADESTLVVYPPDLSDEIIGKAFGWLYRHSKQDTQIGRKLASISAEAGLREIEVRPLTVCFTHSEAVKLRQVTDSVASLLRMIRSMPGGASALSVRELDTAVLDLRRFSDKPGALFSETYFLAIAKA